MLFLTEKSYYIYTDNVNNMKVKVAVLIAIVVIKYISALLKYLHKRNPTSQQKSACNFYQESNILA